MKQIPANQTYRYLEPGPIVLVATSGQSKPNVMTMGFHMMIRHDPALVGCVIGPWDYTYDLLRSSGECVIAVPGLDLAETVVDIGNCSGEQVDKFERFGLKTSPGQAVGAPLLIDCLANFECEVADDALSSKHNLFVLQVKRAWLNDRRTERRTIHHRGDGSFAVDGEILDLSERMTKWRNLP